MVVATPNNTKIILDKYLLELYAQCADAVKNLNVPDSYDSEK